MIHSFNFKHASILWGVVFFLISVGGYGSEESLNEDLSDFSSSHVTLPSVSQNNEMNYTQNEENNDKDTLRLQRKKSRCCKCRYDEDKACCFLEICMILCKCLISIVGDDD